MSCEWNLSVSMQVLVWLLWLGGLGLVGAACAGQVDHPVAVLGVCMVAFGCTGQAGLWIRALAQRERDAFDLGRESVAHLRR